VTDERARRCLGHLPQGITRCDFLLAQLPLEARAELLTQFLVILRHEGASVEREVGRCERVIAARRLGAITSSPQSVARS